VAGLVALGVVADGGCQSLREGAGWDEVTDVAAVELRATDGTEDVVELVSLRREKSLDGDFGRR
jgi:hypothetical protein